MSKIRQKHESTNSILPSVAIPGNIIKPEHWNIANAPVLTQPDGGNHLSELSSSLFLQLLHKVVDSLQSASAGHFIFILLHIYCMPFFPDAPL